METQKFRKTSPRSVPSRTSSQRRALSHFARELEKYARVAGAEGKLPVITPTESDEKASLHTVKPLLPYIGEFEAAGLAVTSKQQRPHPSRNDTHLDGPCDGPVNTSSSSSTGTIIEFTHGEVHHTVVADAATAGDAKPAPKKQDPKNSPQGKCRLPWLRKKMPMDEIEQSQRRKRVGTMVEVSKGEWRLADEEAEARHKACREPRKPPINTSARPAASQAKQRREGGGPGAAASPKSASGQRRSIIKPHILEYVKHTSCDLVKQASPDNEDRSPRFERELARASLPRPARGKLDKKQSPPRRHHCPAHYGSPKEHTRNPGIEGKTSQKQQRERNSPAPKLPYTWKYAISNASSLERALDAAAQRVEKMEAEAVRQSPRRTRCHKHHPLLAKESCQKHRHGAASPPRIAKEPHHPSEAMPLPIQRTASELQEALGDLDVFFDSDDAAIDDRDVLQGLQVAIRAAADDLYDALIRSRTGMRIRRFLSDLKSIDVLDTGLAANQPVRGVHAVEVKELMGAKKGEKKRGGSAANRNENA